MLLIGPKARPTLDCANEKSTSTVTGTVSGLVSLARMVSVMPTTTGCGRTVIPPATYGAGEFGNRSVKLAGVVNVTLAFGDRAVSQPVSASSVAATSASPAVFETR